MNTGQAIDFSHSCSWVPGSRAMPAPRNDDAHAFFSGLLMRYGFYLPTRGPTATRGGILALAREGERLGLHSAMIADHIVLPVESQSTYPYTLDGKHPSASDALETFAILGVVAGATERLRLVTSVLVLPYRNPVLTAKMVASLDVLSGGRITLGVGAGWLKEEFEALNSPSFNARGAVTDEWITIFKQLWSQSPASFKGRFYQYSDIRCEPLPLQKPHPPIWVGGHSRAALRRTARHGDGWHPVGAVAASLWRPPVLRANIDTLKQLTEAEDRDFSALTISYKAPLYDTGIPSPDGSRRPFSGAPEEIAGDIRTFAAIGVHELVFDCRGQSIPESIERLQWFATDVIPLVGG